MTQVFPSSKRRAGLAALQWVWIVLIIATLVLIGLPLTARTQQRNTREAVTEDLMRVVAARERYALDHGMQRGATVPLAALLKDGKYLKSLPNSLIGREVRLDPVGGRVSCRIDGQWFDPLPTRERPAPTPSPY